MMTRRLLKNKKATLFMEYVFTFGTIAMVFVLMNTHVKRTLQARLKDMTDYFIGTEQEQVQDPDVDTESKTDVNQYASLQKLGLGDGKTITYIKDNTETEIKSKTEVPDDANYSPFFDSGHAMINPVPGPDSENNNNNDDADEQVSDTKKDAHDESVSEESEKRDEYRDQAKKKEAQAADKEAQAADKEAQASKLEQELYSNPFMSAQERENLRRQIAELETDASELRSEAKELKKEAAKLDHKADMYQMRIDAIDEDYNETE